MKYIDADKLIATLERQNVDKKVIQPLIRIIDSLQQEQLEVDLDKEIEEYWVATEWSKVITLGKFKVIARYFYGLGQLNSK